MNGQENPSRRCPVDHRIAGLSELLCQAARQDGAGADPAGSHRRPAGGQTGPRGNSSSAGRSDHSDGNDGPDSGRTSRDRHRAGRDRGNPPLPGRFHHAGRRTEILSVEAVQDGGGQQRGSRRYLHAPDRPGETETGRRSEAHRTCPCRGGNAPAAFRLLPRFDRQYPRGRVLRGGRQPARHDKGRGIPPSDLHPVVSGRTQGRKNLHLPPGQIQLRVGGSGP